MTAAGDDEVVGIGDASASGTDSWRHTTPPCGVPSLFRLPPLMRRVPSASRSSIGAFSHSLLPQHRSTSHSTYSLSRPLAAISKRGLLSHISPTSRITAPMRLAPLPAAHGLARRHVSASTPGSHLFAFP